MLLTTLAVVIGGSIAVFHCVTYLLWLYERRVHGPAAPRARLLPALVAWLGEAGALSFTVLVWPLGLRSTQRVTTAGVRRPVVLVPDWGMNRSSLAILAARLRGDGRDAYAINYPSSATDPQYMARVVADRIERIAADSGAACVDVIAHGQGGIVVRAAARHAGADEYIANIVTLGAPHRGAALAAFFRLSALRHLRPGSPYLTRLLEEDAMPTGHHFTAIHSNFDAVVFPAEVAYYPGAMNVTIDDIGHSGLLLNARVYRLAKENIDAQPRDAGVTQAASGNSTTVPPRTPDQAPALG